MESNRDANGQLTPLARRNIDTGLGLERMAQILQRVPNNYETDLILPIVDKAAQLAGMQYALAGATEKTALKVRPLMSCCICGQCSGVCFCTVARVGFVRCVVQAVPRLDCLCRLGPKASLPCSRNAMHLGDCTMSANCCFVQLFVGLWTHEMGPQAVQALLRSQYSSRVLQLVFGIRQYAVQLRTVWLSLCYIACTVWLLLCYIVWSRGHRLHLKYS